MAILNYRLHDFDVLTKKGVRISDRSFGIDAFRYCMAFLVIFIHATLPITDKFALIKAQYILIICRSAVPFYFISSGYFLKIEDRTILSILKSPILRILPIFLFWMVVYWVFLAAYPIVVWESTAQELLSGGAAFHLWFLPALIFGLILTGVAIRCVGVRFAGLICAALAIYGLARGGYHDALGLAGTARRGGFFEAPAFVFIGFCLSRTRFGPKPVIAGTLVVVSLALLLGEETALQHFTGKADFISHDFVFSTYMLGVSVFLLAKSNPGIPFVRPLAMLGKISLGIYAAHMLILWPMERLVGITGLAQSAISAVLTFCVATLLILGVRMIPVLSRVVE